LAGARLNKSKIVWLFNLILKDMNALLAFLPIVVTIGLMAGFNRVAKKALPFSWLLAVLIAFLY